MNIPIKIPENKIAGPKKNPKKPKLPGFFKFNANLNTKSRWHFYENLVLLINSGLDLKKAISALKDESKNASLLEQIEESLIEGSLLSEALLNTRVFSTFEVTSIRIGEETAKVPFVLKELGLHFKEKSELRSLIIGLLIYPLIVLVLALGVTYFMLVEVVPMFEEIFRSFNSELPRITEIVVNVSEIVISNNFTILIVSVCLSIGIFIIWREEKSRHFVQLALLKSPVIGNFIGKVQLSIFSSSFSLMLSSAVPLDRALQLSQDMSRFLPLKMALSQIKDDVIMGASLHSSMQKFPSIFSQRICTLVKVGEESNSLNEIFLRTSHQYRIEIKNQSEILGKVAEPILILLIALFVGFILVAMYMPLFDLGNSVI